MVADVTTPETGAPETTPVGPALLKDLDATLETHRVELTGYCYRMLGSAFEAEDAVQDTLVRAWKAAEKFEGRSSLRSWLYKIATNVCFDMLDGRQRRALPMDMGPARPAADGLPAPMPEAVWLQPVPDARVVPSAADPAEIAELRDTVRLAFITTLQLLPPNQRAVLILREVLAWPAAEVADLLGTSVPSVNSALQRARATLASSGDPHTEKRPLDADEQALVARYVEAFESYDMDRLTALLAEDASWSMPPFDLWLQTHDDIVEWCLGPGIGCDGSKLVPVQANGSPAFAQYKPDPEGGFSAWSLQVLDVDPDGQRLRGVIFFLDVASSYPMFGLPLHLDA
jgi:RNA polymerase sigma-70 factor (ECF subfamily)